MKVPPPSYEESTPALGGQYPPSPQFNNVQQPSTPNANPSTEEQQQQRLDEKLSPYGQQAFCPNCKQMVTTEVKYVSGLFTWILVFLFILFGLFCGCCLIPFCMRSCKDAEHKCSQCHGYIGTYQRIFGTRRRNQQNVPV